MLHFGPATVALWTLSVGADLDEGARAYDQAHPDRVDVERLHSRSRTGSYHFDLAQDGEARHDETVRHLKLADQTAPVRIGNHPIARELTAELIQRAHRHLRMVDSLLDRFGLTGQRSLRVDN